MSSKTSNLIPHLALIMAMLAWSSSFIALKIALSAYSPLMVMAGRMLVASLICLPAIRPILRAMRDKTVRRILILCVLCEPCFYFLFETFALRYTTSGQAGMVIALLPIFVAVGAWFLLKEKLGLRIWLGFLVAIAGVVWLTFGSVSSASAPNPLLGNFLEFGAVLCAAGYTLCAKRLVGSLSPPQLTAAMSFGGFVFFLPLALLPLTISPVPLEISVPGWMPVACIVYLGSIVTFAGYGLYNYGISRLSAGRAAAYTNLIPVVTLFMGVFWLNEPMQPVQYAAAALVVLGVMLSQGEGKKAPPVVVPEVAPDEQDGQ